MSYLIPIIGSAGLFNTSLPFSNALIPNVEYRCQALRTISDYVANNEDAFKLIYEPMGVSIEDFEIEARENMLIACLQSNEGHWAYIPVKYIVNMPILTGEPYRTMAIVVQLPAVHVSLDLDVLSEELRQLATSYVGADAVTRLVETSQTVLVPNDVHQFNVAERDNNRTLRMTSEARVKMLQNQVDELNNTIRSLEDYILQLTP